MRWPEKSFTIFSDLSFPPHVCQVRAALRELAICDCQAEPWPRYSSKEVAEHTDLEKGIWVSYKECDPFKSYRSQSLKSMFFLWICRWWQDVMVSYFAFICNLYFSHMVSSYFREDGVYDITRLACIWQPFSWSRSLGLIARWATELRLKEIHCQPPWGQRQDHACSGQGHRSILAPQLETIQLHFVDFAHFFDLSIFTCHISDWGESTSSTQAEAMLWNCWKVWELAICLSFPKTCCIRFCFLLYLPYLPLDTDQFDLVPLFAKDPPAADDGSEGNGDAVWWFGV